MEESKEQESSEPKMKINTDFLNILKDEIPNLKFTSFPVTKDDIKENNEEQNMDTEQNSEQKVNNGFYDILGLSKRGPSGIQ